MNQRFKLVAIVFLLFASSVSIAQCAADPSSTFKPFSGGEDKPAGHFEWHSGAGTNHNNGGGHPDYAVERSIRNLAGTTLKYSWPVGRMHNDALPGGATDSYCYEVAWPNQNSGPLSYGRGNDQTDTKVWEGSDEPKASALAAEFSLNIDTGAGPRTVSMRVLTSYQRSAEGSFSYQYRFESLGVGTVALEWGVEKDPELLEQVRPGSRLPVIVVEGRKEIHFESRKEPAIGFRSLNVVINEKGAAGVRVPMFVPRANSLAEAR